MPSCSWWSTMNDNQLSALVRAQLLTYLPAGTEVVASYQPTHQGRPGGMTVGFVQIGDEQRAGWPSITERYEEGTGDFLHTETQIVLTTFQGWALSPQDPKDISRPTAKDLAAQAAAYLNSAMVRKALKAQQVSIMRITGVRNPWFENDRNQFEASPSFDFQLCWHRSIVSRTPAAKSVELKILRV